MIVRGIFEAREDPRCSGFLVKCVGHMPLVPFEASSHLARHFSPLASAMRGARVRDSYVQLSHHRSSSC